MSGQNVVRPPLAGIQSALQHSKARGAELAKQAATARVEEEDAERAKREHARELMERRKSYGRATKRAGSPSPRRPSPRDSSTASSALASMRSNLSADETRPASLAASPLPSRRALPARPASPARPALVRAGSSSSSTASPARPAPASPVRAAPASPARPAYASPARPASARRNPALDSGRVASPQRATAAAEEAAAAAGRKRGAPTGGTPQKGGPKKRPPSQPQQPEAAAGQGGGSWRPPLAPATGGLAERERRAAMADRRGSGSCEDLLAQFGHKHDFEDTEETFRAAEAAAEAEEADAEEAVAAEAVEAAKKGAAAHQAEAAGEACRSPASQMMRGLFDRLPFSRPAMPLSPMGGGALQPEGLLTTMGPAYRQLVVGPVLEAEKAAAAAAVEALSPSPQPSPQSAAPAEPPPPPGAHGAAAIRSPTHDLAAPAAAPVPPTLPVIPPLRFGGWLRHELSTASPTPQQQGGSASPPSPPSPP
eukprot:scaffold37398_cov48-Phaeocystis_antarctica.AAC.3